MTEDSTSALSDSQVVGVVYSMYTTSRMRLGETHLWKMQRDAVHSITNTYSLVLSQYFVYIYKANLCLDIILIIIIISIFVDVVAHW